MTTAANLQVPRPQPARRASKDPVHLPLHRRLLFPYDGLDSELPKLVDGEGKDIAIINERLYHLIALALRAYVQSWYTRISPRDRALLPSINSTVIIPLLQPVLTSIYQDSSALVDLILLDLPTILHLHITTYRQARHQESLNYGTLGDAYHARLPLLSVEKKDDSEEWQLSPLYFTSLADGILKSGLSMEEYSSTVERLMARELLGRVILGGVGRRLCEGWFWYGILLRLLGEPTVSVKSPTSPKTKRRPADYLNLVGTRMRRIWTIGALFWSGILSLMALYTSAPTPRPQHRRCTRPWLLLLRAMLDIDGITSGRQAVMSRLLFGSIDTLAIVADPLTDRILPHLIETHILTPSTSIKLIDLLERILFPLDGYPAPTPPDPSSEEVEDMRTRLETRLKSLIPGALKSVISPNGMPTAIEPLSSRECNAHLVGALLDSMVAAVLPELVVTTA